MARKSGGVKNHLYTGFILFVLAGFILAWVNVNNIHSASDIYDYFHAASNKVDKKGRECGADKLEWNCDSSAPQGGGNGKITLPGTTGDGKIHLPSGGGKPGEKININPPTAPEAINNAAPNVASSMDSIKGALSKVKVQPPTTDKSYKRSEWRHWIGEPCNTRNQVLMNQGKNVKVSKTSSSCKITSGEWASPYDGKKITNPSELDIDHMIPLGYAAHHGGQAWSPAKKQQFANDTTQLVAVSANSNRSKSDKGPSEYMPQDSYKCEYAKAWVSTATKYGVSLEKKDKDVLSSTLKNCQ